VSGCWCGWFKKKKRRIY
jgi:hypothetical protein